MNLLKKIAFAAGLCLLGGVGSPVAVANSISGSQAAAGGSLVSSTESGASQLAPAREAEQPQASEADRAVQSDRPERAGKSAGRVRKSRESRAVESMGSRTGDTLTDLMDYNLPSQRL